MDGFCNAVPEISTIVMKCLRRIVDIKKFKLHCNRRHIKTIYINILQ